MELIATTRPAVAYALGAYLINGGKRLRCDTLLVKAGNTRASVILRDPETKLRIRVRLPEGCQNLKGHARFLKETLEVIS